MQPATQDDIKEIRQDLKDHQKKDDDFQAKIFDILGRRFDKIDQKLNSLWDEKNVREGALKAANDQEDIEDRKFSRRERIITIFIGIVTAYATVKLNK